MKRWTVGILAAGALLLAGCSDSDGGEPAAESASPAAATAESPSVEPLRLGATDDEFLDYAAQAESDTLPCPAFLGGTECVAGAELATAHLDAILSAIQHRDGWMPVFGAVTNARNDISLLSGECASLDPANGGGKAREMADCLNAKNGIGKIQQDVLGAISEVHRNGY